MPVSEPVSYDVKQKLTRVLSVFHATHVSVPITDSYVTYLSGDLSVGFMQPGPGNRQTEAIMLICKLKIFSALLVFFVYSVRSGVMRSVPCSRFY